MLHQPRARLLALLVAAGAALALPAGALASGGSPLHIDPRSPVAKAYALPLGSARGAPPGSGGAGKLFGAGITAHRARTRATPTAYLTRASPSGWLWMAAAAVAVAAVGGAGGLALRRRR